MQPYSILVRFRLISLLRLLATLSDEPVQAEVEIKKPPKSLVA